MQSGQTSKQGTVFLAEGKALARREGDSGMCSGSYQSSVARPEECREKMGSKGGFHQKDLGAMLWGSVLYSRQWETTENFRAEKDMARRRQAPTLRHMC